jgi:hypothetical protein
MKKIMIDGRKISKNDFIIANSQKDYDELIETGHVTLSDYMCADLVEDGYTCELFCEDEK